MSEVPDNPDVVASEMRREHLRALVFFLATLLVLYAVAQAHQHRVWVMGAFAVYIVGSTLWVRVQYVDALDGQSYVPRSGAVWWKLVVPGLLATVLGLGIRFLGIDGPISASWFVVGGFLAIYLGAGYLVACSRKAIDTRTWAAADRRRASLRLAGVLAGQLLLTWAGMWMLGRTPVLLAAGVIVVGVLFVPLVLAQLSEHAIESWSRSSRGEEWWPSVVLGTLVVVVAVVVGLATTWIFGLVVLAFAGLIVAIASFTLADIAVVLALIALAGLTPAQDSPDRPLKPPRSDNGDGLLVALGDSYMSGEGASIFVAGTDEGAGNECRRATTAWPMLTGRLTPFNRVVSFACSGADSFHVRHTVDGVAAGSVEAQEIAAMDPTPTPQFDGLETQLDEYDDYVAGFDATEDFAPDLVVLSIGGNDAGFASVGMTCLAPGSCNDDEPKDLWIGGNLSRVQNRIRQVYADVDLTFPDTPVVAIPYIDPIGDGAPCDEAALGKGDVDFLGGFLPALNSRIEVSARQFGFHYAADVEQALAERQLQLCDPFTQDRPGLNFIGLRSVGGLSEQRFNPAKWTHNSLHPNERGHTAVHEAFQRWLAAEGGVAGLEVRRGRTTGTAPVSERNDEVAGECDTFGFDDPEGCKQQSIAWALRQTGAFAALQATPVLLGIGALGWAFAITVFGWRRRRATA